MASTTTAFFKAGNNETMQTGVVAPNCELKPIDPPSVPEPGTMALLGLGAAPLIGRLRRRRKA